MKINKKGQVFQIVFIIVFLVGIALSVLVVTKIQNEFWNAVEAGNLHTNETRAAKPYFDAIPGIYDYSMIFIIAGLTIGLLITSFMIPSNPIFMVINVFGIFFLVFLAMIMSNFYGEMVAGENAPFAVEAEQYPITVFTMNYLPWIAVIIVTLSTIVMFTKGSQSSGGP